ncbi:MAG: hypothetical protein JNN15_20735, partial [Blastocatellia bacterium]|nr:hypothetical protein [Blastocatellia bacterium]
MITKSTDERGTHGHLPSRPELYASLIVAGRGISPGRKEPFVRNVHIAPTVAALLGFAFPGKVEGLALREFLTVAIPQASKTVVAGTEPTVEKPTESRKNRKNKKAKENR